MVVIATFCMDHKLDFLQILFDNQYTKPHQKLELYDLNYSNIKWF